jgi:soluble lytic murein transglycosylase
VRLVAGEALLGSGDALGAVAELEQVGEVEPVALRARLALARAYDALERRSDATRVYETLAARPDPAPAGALVLRALMLRTGPGSPTATGYQRRLYRHYPDSPEERAAGPLAAPTADDVAARADTLMERGDLADVKNLLDPRIAKAPADACVLRYAWGRTAFKKDAHDDALAVLEPLGAACKGTDEDRGAKALFLAARIHSKAKRWTEAERAYRAIAEHYPTHSMADDGLVGAGIVLQEMGQLAAARATWATALERYPDGDQAAESIWRLAWGAWTAGDAREAVRWADLGRDALTVERGANEVLACAYWGARWRAWPSRSESRLRSTDATAVGSAAVQLESLARTAPWHWYGMLAAQRLAELAPERAAALQRPTGTTETRLPVRESWLASAPVARALRLAQLGLIGDAAAELDSVPVEGVLAGEYALARQLEERAGRFLVAHGKLRAYLAEHPPGAIGPNPWPVLRMAYPQKWWPEVDAAHDYAWDARLFHALVREESSFNPDIESAVGAKGLSQLMPATASRMAREGKIPYAPSRIKQPATNLRIGAYLLDTLIARYDGNTALALAGYNAGPGHVDRWLAAAPDAPLDEYVENIGFKETRHYVKRVSSTWQTHRLLYGEGPLYPDLSRFTYDAHP